MEKCKDGPKYDNMGLLAYNMANSGHRICESVVLFGIEGDGCMATGEELIRSHFGAVLQIFSLEGHFSRIPRSSPLKLKIQ